MTPRPLTTSFHIPPSPSRIPQVPHYVASSDATEDPGRKGLYYHPVGDNLFALSFLSEKPPRRDSATVIGLINRDEGLSSFRENQAFVDLLHDTVKAALIEGVAYDMENDAKRRQEGWLHVHDLRNFPESGRVGEAADIVGSVLARGGEIQGETYQRVPAYRQVLG